MKSMWTKDEMHKVEGQLRFFPGVQYKTVTRPGPSGAPEFERKAGDPKTLAWQPSYEFGWTVSDSTLVKKALTTKEGRHPIVVHAVLHAPPTGARPARCGASSAIVRPPGGRRSRAGSGSHVTPVSTRWSGR
ncbi:hypothetical protein GCM10020254_33930 [Streptomyces goshikiensis]